MRAIVARPKVFAFAALVAAPFFAAGGGPAVAQADDPFARSPDRPRSEWRASAGFNYSTGFYGEPRRTSVMSAPFSVKYTRGDLSLRASIPWTRIVGPADIQDTPQGRIGGNRDNAISEAATRAAAALDDRRSGLGDVSVSALYSFDLGHSFYIDTAARVKFPTASASKGLGSGRTDAVLGADFVKEAGDAEFYAGARRKFASIGARGRDVWGAGAGASYWLTDSVNAGIDYDWQQASFVAGRPSSEATLWAGFRLTKRLRARVYATRGLNGDSADFAGGLTLSWRLSRR